MTDLTLDELLALTKPVLERAIDLFDDLEVINKRWDEYSEGSSSRIRFTLEENTKNVVITKTTNMTNTTIQPLDDDMCTLCGNITDCLLQTEYGGICKCCYNEGEGNND